MQGKKRSVFILVILVAGLANAQATDPKLIESVRELAASRVKLNLCLASPDFRKLADSSQRQIIAISNRLDRLSNDLHEAPKGKLLFVSYGMQVTRLGRSAEFRRQLLEGRGGVCDFGLVADLDSKLKIARRSIPPP